MAFRAAPVRVRVPATSANLGPGFDALGGQPRGLEVVCANRIPHSRGLGSSAAAIVAGLAAARALVLGGVDTLDDDALLALAADLEGHPDNVAACLLGGLTLAWTPAGGPAQAVRLPVSQVLRPVVFVPTTSSSTAKARKMLPETVPHADAARNAARSALLVHALAADPSLLLAATEDRLHQQYRAGAQARTAGLVEALRADGVPAVVSGAGPSVLAFAGAADDLSSYAPRGWAVEVLAVDPAGVELLGLAG